MKITLITVGKIKEKYLKDAIAEYSKRLSKYCKLEIVEVADEKTPDQASENVERQIRQKEGERILRYVKDDAYVFTLEIGGTMLDSVAFAKKDGNLGNTREKSFDFYNWRFHWFGRRSIETFRLCIEFFKDDVSTSIDAGDFIRTGVSWLSDH